MDIRSLTCFVALAERLHFRRAAEALNVTQPALSQRIRLLEKEIGTPLLVRDRRRVALTAAGEAFLGPAQTAVSNAALARTQALRAARGEVGRLRLGFTVIAFYGWLPDAVRAYRSRFPDVVIELAEMNSPALERSVAAGEVDLAVLHPPVATPQLEVKSLSGQRLVLALPRAHSLARRATIKMRDLDGEPFLIAPRSIGPHIYDRVIALFRRCGISPNIVQEVTPMTTLTGLVAAGVGMGFVTEGVATVARRGVAFRPVSPDAPVLPMAAAWRGPELSALGRQFLEIADEQLGRRGGSSLS